MNRALLSLTILTVFAFATPLAASAASFDCAKASKPDEIAICGNPGLSQLDTEMGALWFAFDKVPMPMGSSGARRDAAEDFLRKRTACGSDVACLRTAYQARNDALRSDITQAMDNVFQEENADPVTPTWSTATLPAPIQAVVAQYAKQCGELGGALPQGQETPAVMTADLDGDDVQDYVLNPQNLQCSAAATAFCGNGGCDIRIAVSGDGYAHPLSVLGGQPTLTQQAEGTAVDIWVDGEHCNLPDKEQACWMSTSWQDGKPVTTYEARPRQE